MKGKTAGKGSVKRPEYKNKTKLALSLPSFQIKALCSTCILGCYMILWQHQHKHKGRILQGVSMAKSCIPCPTYVKLRWSLQLSCRELLQCLKWSRQLPSHLHPSQDWKWCGKDVQKQIESGIIYCGYRAWGGIKMQTQQFQKSTSTARKAGGQIAWIDSFLVTRSIAAQVFCLLCGFKRDVFFATGLNKKECFAFPNTPFLSIWGIC